MTVIERVRSADGTEIALEQVTDGPRRLLLVPGGPAGRGRWARTAAPRTTEAPLEFAPTLSGPWLARRPVAARRSSNSRANA